MQLNKKDVVTIAVLMVVFLSLATWNLGLVQAPATTAQLTDGQSFYLDLGNAADVKSVFVLYKDGHFNLTVSSGALGSWQIATANKLYPYDFSNSRWSLDYYKWQEISVQKTTQYIGFNFSELAGSGIDSNEASKGALIVEIAVVNQDNQQISISTINNTGIGNPALANLVDEQSKVDLPVTYMSETYFDEIYFVRTAEQYLNHQWPYEWTHPPLGKLIQAAGIGIFGYSPFGWRFMGVIFAALMIPVMYFLGKKLLGSWIGGFSAAFLLTFDFMHFTMGRMGTVDTYVVFFSLLSQLCFLVYFLNVLKQGWKTSVVPLFFAVLFFALGFSSKWLVLYGAVGMLAMLVALRIKDLSKIKGKVAKYAGFFDHPFLILLGFICVAIGIYFATYIPDMIVGRPFIGTYGNGVVDLQFAMYNYHSTLTATHTFSSVWWSWPLLTATKGYVPLWLAVSTLPGGMKSTISVFGNPSVWWVGFACIIGVTLYALKSEQVLSALRMTFRKKPLTDNSGSPTEAAEDEAAVQEDETRARSKRIVIAALGFVVIVVTALCAELLSYHSFLLALPLYAGLFAAAYGMIANFGINPDRKEVAAVFIILIFFFSWIPYIFISRATFIYHFYVSMPFLCLATAYVVNRYWNTFWGRVGAIALFQIVILVFVIFYPVISGAPATQTQIDNLKLFPSWYF